MSQSVKHLYCKKHNLWHWSSEECGVCKAVREGELPEEFDYLRIAREWRERAAESSR